MPAYPVFRGFVLWVLRSCFVLKGKCSDSKREAQDTSLIKECVAGSKDDAANDVSVHIVITQEAEVDFHQSKSQAGTVVPLVYDTVVSDSNILVVLCICDHVSNRVKETQLSNHLGGEHDRPVSIGRE